MAKFSKKMMGKEVGDASVYAEPHDMKGRAGVDLSNSGYGKAPKKSAARTRAEPPPKRQRSSTTRSSDLKVPEWAQ